MSIDSVFQIGRGPRIFYSLNNTHRYGSFKNTVVLVSVYHKILYIIIFAIYLGSCEFVERDDRFSWTFHVGPAGGVLQVLTIVLSIPEGALTEDVAITIIVSTNKHDTPSLKDDQCLAGPIIHCLPHGLRFQKTVALTFGYNEHLAATQADANLMVMCRFVTRITKTMYTDFNWSTERLF